MKKLIWVILCFAVLRAPHATAEKKNNFMITICYGPEGQKPLYSYQIFEDTRGALSCKLSSGQKTISSGKLEWPSDLHALTSALLDDFAKSTTGFEAKAKTKGMRKSISVAWAKGDFEQVVAVNGDDETLNAFIAHTHMIRELFEKVSDGKPKLYRLWDEPGPLKAMMPEKIKP
jgi:hypothetical protein